MQTLAREAQFRLMVESVRDYAIFMLDVQGHVLTWNTGARALQGYEPEEVIGRHHSACFAPEEIASGRPAAALAMAAQNAHSEDEHWLVRKDGTRFWAHVTIDALHDVDGTLIGFVEVARDATAHVREAEQFRRAIEAAPTGMLMTDREGSIVLVNAQLEKQFGYEREELIGKPVELLVPERFRARHSGHRAAFSRDAKARPMGVGRDLFGLRKDGGEIPIEIGLNPLQTRDGEFVLGSVVDITERKRAELERASLVAQLKALNSALEERVRSRTSDLMTALKEREVLLQEVHHRVKNNLQIVSSLINMQLRKADIGVNHDALKECQTRVQAIALIHEKLYQSKDYARVPFSEYIRSLASSVFQATGASSPQVSLDLALDEVWLSVDQAIPCGLLLNELITNSIKHAFTDGRAGTIRVELAKIDDGRIRLGVEDDGVGMPDGMNIHEVESLGLQLVCALAEQLEGNLEVIGRRGTSFQLTFAAEA
ncbi:MAG TPA: PAS domain S-box protein [Polyangiaceae bacterium]